MTTGFRSTRVVIEGEVRPATVRIAGGVFTGIDDGTPDHDFGDLVIMPGLVDSHVHVNDPGRSDWEGFATATAAAVAGGCTTIVDMPLNSIPPTLDMEALHEKQEAAAGRLTCDVAFWGGFTGSTDHLSELVEGGVCGFKSFLVDSGVEEFPPVTLGQLADGIGAMAWLGVPALVHAEDPEGIRPHEGDPRSYRDYADTRPIDSEVTAVKSVSAIASRTGAEVHVLHLSSGEAAAAIAAGPVNLTGETCPHYLMFAADEIADGATQFKCSPPIRDSEHREALWDALREGWLSMVVSDHSPSPPGLKPSGDFSKAWGGISSLQLRLSATWTGASTRAFGPLELTAWLSTAPARLAGLDDRKGSIEVGKDGDLVVWDPDGVSVTVGEGLLHRHTLTPYEGATLRGSVVATVLRGETVFNDGRVVEGHGRMLRRR